MIQKKITYYIRNSFFAHLCLLGIITLVSLWAFYNENKIRTYNLKLIESSVQVDIVSMPKMTVSELKKLQEMNSEGPTTEEIISDQEQNETNSSDFLSYMKELSKKKDEDKNKSKKISKKKKISKDKMAQVKRFLNEGNLINKGTSVYKESEGISNVEFNEYALSLPDLIRPFWKIPRYLANQELKCRIRIFLSEQGRLIRMEILESSGNEEYDQFAIQSIKSAGSFPSPEKSIQEKLLHNGIVLGFPL